MPTGVDHLLREMAVYEVKTDTPCHMIGKV